MPGTTTSALTPPPIRTKWSLGGPLSSEVVFEVSNAVDIVVLLV